MSDGAKRTWEAVDPHDGCCGKHCTLDGCSESHPVGEVCVEGPDWDYEMGTPRLNSEADARLIAAAPDMADVLLDIWHNVSLRPNRSDTIRAALQRAGVLP